MRWQCARSSVNFPSRFGVALFLSRASEFLATVVNALFLALFGVLHRVGIAFAFLRIRRGQVAPRISNLSLDHARSGASRRARNRIASVLPCWLSF